MIRLLVSAAIASYVFALFCFVMAAIAALIGPTSWWPITLGLAISLISGGVAYTEIER